MREFSLGEWIENELNVQHMTRKELSERTGISTSAICLYIRGSRNPTMMTVVDILNGFGKHIEVVDNDR